MWLSRSPLVRFFLGPVGPIKFGSKSYSLMIFFTAGPTRYRESGLVELRLRDMELVVDFDRMLAAMVGGSRTNTPTIRTV